MIVYTDAFAYWKVRHYPHYVLIMKKKNSKYRVFDPWDGKQKWMSKSMLSKAISGVRRMGFKPELILND